MRDSLPGGQCAADDAGGPQFEAAETMSTAAVHGVGEKRRRSNNLKLLTINVTSWGTLKEMLTSKNLDKYDVVAVEEHKLRSAQQVHQGYHQGGCASGQVQGLGMLLR